MSGGGRVGVAEKGLGKELIEVGNRGGGEGKRHERKGRVERGRKMRRDEERDAEDRYQETEK